MLWVGWFGFNAGSELAIDGVTASAFATTHFSAAAGAVTWAGIEWLQRGKPTLLGASTGSGGRIGLHYASRRPRGTHVFVDHGSCRWAGVLPLLFGAQSPNWVTTIRSMPFGVHGMGGTLGAILTGVFATRAAWDIAGGQPLGMIEGNYSTIVGQIVATVVTWVFAAVVSFALLKLIDATLGLRVPSTVETTRAGRYATW